MGTDIWVHAEYLNYRRRRYQHIDKEFLIYRSYLLFDILGCGRGRREPLYCQRGLPNDVTAKTYKEFKDGELDFHDASWLTTQEYRKCLDRYCEIVNAKSGEAYEWRLDYIAPELEPDPKIIADYERIYRCLKSSEDKGNPARVVFWFDN